LPDAIKLLTEAAACLERLGEAFFFAYLFLVSRVGRDRLMRPAPKEQPPRKLSGKRTLAILTHLERGIEGICSPICPPTG